MEQKAEFHYFYGEEADMHSFYRIPKLLFTNDYFKALSKHDLDGYIIIFTSNMSQETYQKKIPDSLKSRFDMVYYFVNVPGQEKQLFIQNSALELIEKLQIHFGKKVSYESITDELEKLIAYDNLRDIKRKVQDIVFCEFFKIR